MTLADGRNVNLVRFPARVLPPLLGFYQRRTGERLDNIASAVLSDPTSFWQLCDVSEAMSPHALAARPLIAVPREDT